MAEKIPIEFDGDGSRTKSVASGGNEATDKVSVPEKGKLLGTFKADSASPASGETVDVFLEATAGNPDGDQNAGADEHSSGDRTHGEYICTLDSNVTDPAVITVAVPNRGFFNLRFWNDGAAASTISGVLEVRFER